MKLILLLLAWAACWFLVLMFTSRYGESFGKKDFTEQCKFAAALLVLWPVAVITFIFAVLVHWAIWLAGLKK